MKIGARIYKPHDLDLGPAHGISFSNRQFWNNIDDHIVATFGELSKNSKFHYNNEKRYNNFARRMKLEREP